MILYKVLKKHPFRKFLANKNPFSWFASGSRNYYSPCFLKGDFIELTFGHYPNKFQIEMSKEEARELAEKLFDSIE